jgi:hypothetical protein
MTESASIAALRMVWKFTTSAPSESSTRLPERIERLERQVEELREVVGDDSQDSENSGGE